MHNPCAAGFGGRLMLRDHLRNPLWLTGQVEVVRTGFCTHFDQGRAIQGVRANRGHQHIGQFAQFAQGLFMIRVGNNQRQLGSRLAEFGAQCFQLRLRAPGDGPAHVASHPMSLYKIARQNLPNKTAGTKQHEIKCSHGRTP